MPTDSIFIFLLLDLVCLAILSPSSFPCASCPNPDFVERLEKTWEREQSRFLADYNNRLLGGLSGLSFLGILLFRFAVPVRLLETASWVAFAFLQVREGRDFQIENSAPFGCLRE